MALLKRRNLLVAAALVVLLAATHTLWMRALGQYLVKADEPFKADAIVVLGGDFWGDRIVRAAQLVKQQYAPKAYVSGPDGIYGRFESDLAIEFATKQGYPPDYFVPWRNRARSTVEEAGAIVAELKRNNVRRLMIVTSDFHTRRAGRIWRAAAPDLDIRVIGAPCREFDPDAWWSHRQSQKTFLTEWEKTVANWLGM